MSRSVTILSTLLISLVGAVRGDAFRCPNQGILAKFQLDQSASITNVKCLSAPSQPICSIRLRCTEVNSFVSSLLIQQSSQGRLVVNLECCRHDQVKMANCQWVAIDSLLTQPDGLGLRNANLTSAEICQVLTKVESSSSSSTVTLSTIVTPSPTHKISTRETTTSNITVCPPAPIPQNGYATNGTFGSNEVGRSMTFACWPDYNLTGPATVTCKADGNWSSPIPSCSRICQPLSTAVGGDISYSPAGKPIFSGTSAKFNCSGRCAKATPSESVCVGPQWTVESFSCQPRCPPLALSAGLKVSPALPECGDVGSVVKFSCDNQCLRPSVESSSCLATGEWSPSAANCIPIGCAPVSPPTGGSVSGGTDLCNKVGSVAKFSCPACSSPWPSASATCEATGLWSTGNITCRPDCPQLSPPVSGSASAGTSGCSPAGTTVTFRCDGTFQISSSDPLRCLETGKWSAPVPFCGGCKAFPYSPFGGVEIYNTTVSASGYFATYTEAKLFCNEPYKKRPVPESVTCLNNGRWGDATCWPK